MHETHCWHERPEIRTSTNGETACMGLIVGTKDPKFARRPMEKPLAWDSLLARKTRNTHVDQWRNRLHGTHCWHERPEIRSSTNGETACMGLIVGTKDPKFARRPMEKPLSWDSLLARKTRNSHVDQWRNRFHWTHCWHERPEIRTSTNGETAFMGLIVGTKDPKFARRPMEKPLSLDSLLARKTRNSHVDQWRNRFHGTHCWHERPEIRTSTNGETAFMGLIVGTKDPKFARRPMEKPLSWDSLLARKTRNSHVDQWRNRFHWTHCWHERPEIRTSTKGETACMRLNVGTRDPKFARRPMEKPLSWDSLLARKTRNSHVDQWRNRFHGTHCWHERPEIRTSTNEETAFMGLIVGTKDPKFARRPMKKPLAWDSLLARKTRNSHVDRWRNRLHGTHCWHERPEIRTSTNGETACMGLIVGTKDPKFPRRPMKKPLAWDSLLARKTRNSHVDQWRNRLHGTHCWHERPEIRTSTNEETAFMGLIVGTKDPKFARRPMEKPLSWDSLLARKTRNSHVDRWRNRLHGDSLLARKTRNSHVDQWRNRFHGTHCWHETRNSHVDQWRNRFHGTHCWHERPEIPTSTNGETAFMGLIVGTKDPKFARRPMEKPLSWDSLLARKTRNSHVDQWRNRLHATHCWHERPEIRTSTNGETAFMGLIVGTKDPKFARRPMEKPLACDSLLARKTRNSHVDQWRNRLHGTHCWHERPEIRTSTNGETACMGLIVGTKDPKFARRPMEKPLAWDSLLARKTRNSHVDQWRNRLHATHCWHERPEIRTSTNGETACMGLIVGTKDPKFARRPMETTAFMGLIVGTKDPKFARRPMKKPLAWDSLLARKTLNSHVDQWRNRLHGTHCWHERPEIRTSTNGETACMGLIVEFRVFRANNESHASGFSIGRRANLGSFVPTMSPMQAVFSLVDVRISGLSCQQ